MAKENRSKLKTYFESGDRPTQGQFSNFIDSTLNFTSDDIHILQAGDSTRLGIGQNNPASKLDVNGDIKASGLQITGGAQQGLVLISDANGVATWQPVPNGTPSTLQEVTEAGNTTDQTIQVEGIDTNNFSMVSGGSGGRVLTSDDSGTGTWQDLPENPPQDLQSVTQTGNTTDQTIQVDGIDTNNFSMVSGASNGRVLTSDDSGVGTWQDLPATPTLQQVTDAGNSTTGDISVNAILTNAFTLPTGATQGFILYSDAEGTGTWQAAPTFDTDTYWKAGTGTSSMIAVNDTNSSAEGAYAVAIGNSTSAEADATFVTGVSNVAAGINSAVIGGNGNGVAEEATNSVVLGGTGIQADAPDTAYVANFEIHGDVLGKYTNQPDSHPAFDDLTLITKRYGDRTPNAPYIGSVQNSSFQPGQTRTLLISGANFDNQTGVEVPNWTGSIGTPVVVSDKEIQLQLTAPSSGALNNYSVILNNRQKFSNNSYSTDAGANSITVNVRELIRIRPPQEPPITEKKETVAVVQIESGLRATTTDGNFDNYIKFPTLTWQRGTGRTFSFTWMQDDSGTWAFGIGSDQADPNANQQQFEGEVLMYVINNKIWGFYGGGGVANWSQRLPNGGVPITYNQYYKTIFYDDGGNGSLFEIYEVSSTDFDTHGTLVASGTLTTPANNLNLEPMGILNSAPASIAEIDLI